MVLAQIHSHIFAPQAAVPWLAHVTQASTAQGELTPPHRLMESQETSALQGHTARYSRPYTSTVPMEHTPTTQGPHSAMTALKVYHRDFECKNMIIIIDNSKIKVASKWRPTICNYITSF